MYFFDGRKVAAVIVLLAGMSLPAAAQGQQANSGNSIPDVSAAALAAFKADPVAFISEVVASKGDVAATLGGIIVKDPTVLTSTSAGKPSLVAQASKSVPDQQKAFVKGLADAAHSFVASKQQEAFTAVQTAVVLQFDSAFQADFTSAIADIRTTALGASGGAGGGAINGLQNGGPNSQPANFTSDLVKNGGPGSPQVGVTGATSSSSGTSGTGTSTSTITTITRTVNVSVSPAGLSSF